MMRGAVVSHCGQYRYELIRGWDNTRPMLVVVMLNPSTADAADDDPTVRVLTRVASAWGHGGLMIVNLHAYRTSRPAELWAARGRGIGTLGRGNWITVRAALDYAAATSRRALVAWGADGNRLGLASTVVADAGRRGVALVCLGTNADGSPRHPMARGAHRIPADVEPIAWSMPR